MPEPRTTQFSKPTEKAESIQAQVAAVLARYPSLKKIDSSAYTVQQVARALQCTDVRVANMVEEGKLQAINIGSSERKFWRVPVESLAAYVAKNLH